MNQTERFDRMLQAHGRRIFAVIRRFVPERAAAEDLYQEVWLRAWRSIDALDAGRDPLPYLRTLAINRAIDHLRRTRARPAETGHDLDAQQASDGPAADLEDVLARLPAHERAAILLYYQEGRSVAEVAAALAVPAGTVKTWLFRARARLRATLGDPPGDAP